MTVENPAEDPTRKPQKFVKEDLLPGQIVPLVRLKFPSQEEEEKGTWVLGYVSGTSKYGVRYFDGQENLQAPFAAGIQSEVANLQEISLALPPNGEIDVWPMDGDVTKALTGLPSQDATNPKIRFYPDDGDIETLIIQPFHLTRW